MRLPFQRSERTERAPDPAKRPAADAGEDAIAAARTLARRRLIGAFVLLALGVVGFPILFETQPRPLPAHTPIITAQGEPIAAALAAPAMRAVPPRAASPAVEAPPEPEPVTAAPPSSPPAAPRPAASKAPAEAAPAEGRFVVQVGAFSDASMLRETRQKVEKLGLKTYTQVIEGDAGKRTRVRVGPYPTRAEAQAAAAKLKAAGLPANLLTL